MDKGDGIMHLKEILDMPTTIDGTHESMYQSYHVLEKLLDWLETGVPGKEAGAIIAELFDKEK